MACERHTDKQPDQIEKELTNRQEENPICSLFFYKKYFPHIFIHNDMYQMATEKKPTHI